MIYLIRTIWVMSFLALVTMGAGTAYVLVFHDPASLNDCILRMAGGAGAAAVPSAQEILLPCIGPFMEENRDVFLAGGLIAGAPLAVYLAWRLVRGWARARQSYRIADLKGWF